MDFSGQKTCILSYVIFHPQSQVPSAEKQLRIVILVYILAAGRKQTKVSQTYKYLNVFVLSVFGV